MSARRVIGCVAAGLGLAAIACSVGPRLPATANVTCATDRHCPAGFACAENLGRCVRAADDDHRPPALVGAVTLEPPTATRGTAVTVTFATDEPLGLAPALLLDGPRVAELVAEPLPGAAGTFVLQLAIDDTVGEGDQPVGVRLADRFGNEAELELGTLRVDFTGPVVIGLAWVTANGATRVRSDAVVALTATVDLPATVQAGSLWDGAVMVADLSAALLVGADGSLRGGIDLASLPPATSLVAEVRFGDDLNNTTTERTAALVVDDDPPETSWVAVPTSPSLETLPVIEMASDEPGTFVCVLDGAGPEPCASPWTPPRLRIGSHHLAAWAVDEAGNADATPVEHSWEVERVWSQVTLANAHGCALATDSSLWCWGHNGNPQSGGGQLGDGTLTSRTSPAPIVSPLDWVGVTTGLRFTCAVHDDGGARCWGANEVGQLGIGSDLAFSTVPIDVDLDRPVRSVSAGDQHACAVAADGTLWCWGANSGGQLGVGFASGASASPLQVGVETDWLEAVTGRMFTCGVRAAQGRSLWCWGAITARQRDGLDLPPLAPAQQSPAGGWRELAGGYANVCGVRAGGLYCLGENDLGQLRDGTTIASLVPLQIGTDTDWLGAAVAVHEDLHASVCGLRAGGVRECWGDNAYGQLGGGLASAVELTLPPVADGFVRLALTTRTACGVRGDGALACWGSGEAGLLGEGQNNRYNPVPRRVGQGAAWAAAAVGRVHACALKLDGSLWCWGDNSTGQLGLGSFAELRTAVPRQVGTATSWVALSAGEDHTCAVADASGQRTLWCWGGNGSGQLGLGAGQLNDQPAPVQVGTATDWQSVSVGLSYSCGIRGAGELWCWGANERDQLGTGSAVATEPAPMRVGAHGDWLEVIAGQVTTRGRRSDGVIYAWGTGYSSTPTADGAETDWLAWGHMRSACGVRAGDLFCWGGTTSTGILGPGGVTSVRNEIPGDVVWQTVSVGWSFACAIDDLGQLWCWGTNAAGVLGTGAVGDSAFPAVVAQPGPWLAVAVSRGSYSYVSACAVRDDGGGGRELWCWGMNTDGQLGDGTGFRTSPADLAAP